MKWNQECSNVLVSLREEGRSVQYIADKLEVSKSTVEYWIKSLGLHKNKPWTTEEEDILTKLTLEGFPSKYCASILNRRDDTVRARKVKLGLGRKDINGLVDVTDEAIKSIGDKSFKYSMKQNLLTKVYVIDFGEFYKIGITQQSIKNRFAGNYPKYEIVFYIETDLDTARDIESKWISNVAMLKFIPDNLPREGGGFTECFKLPE